LRKRADCDAEQARLAAQPGGVGAATDEAHRRATFKSHTVLCCELVEWVVAEQIPGPFAFDSYFPNAPGCNHIHGQGRAYVGDLKSNRKVWFRAVELRATEMAAQVPFNARRKVTLGDRTQGDFTKKIWLPEYPPAVRVVILWEHGNGKEPVKILLTNQTHWQVTSECCAGMGTAGQARKPCLGTASRMGAWATVNCAAVRARRGISTSCCWCPGCSWLNCARAVRVRGPPRG
jgi:hypothetical protein